MSKTKVIFRADASASIGYGHFVRSLALADMLSDDFHTTFATRNPTEFMIDQVDRTCDELISLSENHFEEFLVLLTGVEIVVLDNYFFTTDYQRQIKDRGCKLVCVDDMHDKHYVADVVINHGLTDESLFSIEPYTQLCLGLEWALLRAPFRENHERVEREEGHCVVAFGGSDIYNLTVKFAEILSAKKEINKITAIIGDAYKCEDELRDISKVEIRKNLTAQEMAEMFREVEFAVLPTSTISIEAIACGCIVYGGYYVDNQEEFYNDMTSKNNIIPQGDLRIVSDICLQNITSTRTNIRTDKTRINYQNIFKFNMQSNKTYHIENYDICDYTTLNREQLVEVLEARNSLDVRKWMFTDTEISLTDHLNYVESLKTKKDVRYFAVYENSELIGCIYVTDIIDKPKSGFWGLFLNPKFMDMGKGLDLEYVALKLFFDCLNFDFLNGDVDRDNIGVIKLHSAFKFAIDTTQEGKIFKFLTTKGMWGNVKGQSLSAFKLNLVKEIRVSRKITNAN